MISLSFFYYIINKRSKKFNENNKHEVISLIDVSFKNNGTDLLIRWCKAIILCAGASQLNLDDYFARLSVCSLLLDYDFNDNIICPCKAKELLGIEHYSSGMFSEKYLEEILLKINRNNYDSIEIV